MVYLALPVPDHVTAAEEISRCVVKLTQEHIKSCGVSGTRVKPFGVQKARNTAAGIGFPMPGFSLAVTKCFLAVTTFLFSEMEMFALCYV